jgi:hypothetical protein
MLTPADGSTHPYVNIESNDVERDTIVTMLLFRWSCVTKRNLYQQKDGECYMQDSSPFIWMSDHVIVVSPPA